MHNVRLMYNWMCNNLEESYSLPDAECMEEQMLAEILVYGHDAPVCTCFLI